MSFLKLATQTGFTIATAKLASDLYEGAKKKIKEAQGKNKNQDEAGSEPSAAVTD